MKPLFRRALVCCVWLLASSCLAQDILQHLFTSTVEDIAEIKRRAEAGDVAAQKKLANTLAAQFRSAEALEWYRKAAQRGDLEAFYQVGRLLLYGAIGSAPQQAVAADPQTGVFIIFRAATNRHVGAYRDLYRAYREGRGVAKDTVEAYAWLQLHVDATGGLLPSSARMELNQLALAVDVDTSQAGKRRAMLYQSGHWPKLVVAPPPPPASPLPSRAADPPRTPAPTPPAKPPPDLKLNAITQGRIPLAIINGKMLTVGETGTVPAKPQSLSVKCLKIETDSVEVAVEGYPDPIQLRLK